MADASRFPKRPSRPISYLYGLAGLGDDVVVTGMNPAADFAAAEGGIQPGQAVQFAPAADSGAAPNSQVNYGLPVVNGAIQTMMNPAPNGDWGAVLLDMARTWGNVAVAKVTNTPTAPIVYRGGQLVPAPVQSAGISPLILIAGAGILALVLLRGR